MRVAAGLKSHSGWAVLVVLGEMEGQLHLVERRRIELVDEADAAWAKQPYHAAEELPGPEAEALVGRGIASAHRVALQEIRALADRMAAASHQLVGGGVLIGAPMPGWTTAQILAVHMRMHKAEGLLFPEALGEAIRACGVPLNWVQEREVDAQALAWRRLAALGAAAGPPWGKDQKLAACAALAALTGP